MKLKCLYQNVLVKLDEKNTMSKGGIIIPDIKERPRHTGIVEYVGHGAIKADGSIRPLIVKVGDKVLFGRYAGLPLKINGVDYRHMREDEIIGIIEDGDFDIEDDDD